MKKHRKVILALVCLAVALCLIAYPIVAELLSNRYHSDIQTTYTETVAETGDSVLAAELKKAQAYNAMLASGAVEGEDDSSPSYAEILNVGGVMAYVEIPKISVHLPVYHGTDASTLEHAVGHVAASSLPIGGESTHAVLSAHSGMASARLFSDIDQLQLGDVFFIHVLDQTLAYQVNQIETVLPSDTSLLHIEKGKDYVTLVTCVPFGVNTHRLLVRGTRIALEDVPQEAVETTHVSTWRQHYWMGLAAGVVLLGTGTGIYLYRRKRHA